MVFTLGLNKAALVILLLYHREACAVIMAYAFSTFCCRETFVEGGSLNKPKEGIRSEAKVLPD